MSPSIRPTPHPKKPSYILYVSPTPARSFFYVKKAFDSIPHHLIKALSTTMGQSILPQHARRPNATWDYSITAFQQIYQSSPNCSDQTEIDALESVKPAKLSQADSTSLRKSLTLSQGPKAQDMLQYTFNHSPNPPSPRHPHAKTLFALS